MRRAREAAHGHSGGQARFLHPRHQEAGQHQEEIDPQIAAPEHLLPAKHRAHVQQQHAQRGNEAQQLQPRQAIGGGLLRNWRCAHFSNRPFIVLK